MNVILQTKFVNFFFFKLSFGELNFYDLASPSYQPIRITPIIYASQTVCLHSKILFAVPTLIWMSWKIKVFSKQNKLWWIFLDI